MRVNVLELGELERKLGKKSPIDFLAPEVGKVYVVAITRDGCPACEKQKPKLDSLAAVIRKRHGSRVAFTLVHVKYRKGSQEESLRSKDVFGHYFYPTNLILLRTADRGVFEYYRAAAPRMNELERNIESAVKIAGMMKKEAG